MSETWKTDAELAKEREEQAAHERQVVEPKPQKPKQKDGN